MSPYNLKLRYIRTSSKSHNELTVTLDKMTRHSTPTSAQLHSVHFRGLHKLQLATYIQLLSSRVLICHIHSIILSEVPYHVKLLGLGLQARGASVHSTISHFTCFENSCETRKMCFVVMLQIRWIMLSKDKSRLSETF